MTHPAIVKIQTNGYRLFHEINEDDFSKEIVIRAYFNNEEIGEATFVVESQPVGGMSEFGHCDNIEILEEHQKKGVGTAIYVFAEQVLGKKLMNYWGDDPDQTTGAKALWAQKNRPFGE